MSGFLGSYRHQIDEKGRVSLPAPFRRDADERPFVLAQVYAHALTLYPADTWAAVEERMLEVLRRKPASRAVSRPATTSWVSARAVTMTMATFDLARSCLQTSRPGMPGITG